MRKVLVTTVLIAAIVIPRAGSAQMPVVDHGNLLENIKIALQTAQLVTMTANQLAVMEAQLRYQLQNLKTIDASSLSGLLTYLNQVQMTFAALQGDLNSIGYTASLVNGNFTRLFPGSQGQWQPIPSASFNGYYDNWHAEITASSLAAARAQTVVSTLDANNAAVRKALLTANNASTGEVQQLELINQQLALIHGELANLVQNVAALGRVVTDYVAASTGNDEINLERGRRRLQNYTYRGPPSNALKALP